MSIEITLLKIRHESVEDARKLIPYIEGCDVLSPEDSGITEEQARESEDSWEYIVNSGLSRTKFSETVERRLSPVPPSQKPYAERLQDYLFRNGRLIWSAERFSQQESEELRRLDKERGSILTYALDALKQAQLDRFFGRYWEAINTRRKMNLLRDQHIGKNLDAAEGQIRDRYSRLANKSSLKFVVLIGRMHYPERYTTLPVEIHDLTDKSIKLAYECETLDEAKPILLAGEAKNVFLLSDEEAKQMSFEELTDKVKKLAAEKRFR